MAKMPKPDSMEEIGRRLRLIRIAFGYISGYDRELEQKEIAQLCGINRQSWNNSEKGRARLGLDFAKLVRRRTGATLDYIFEGETANLPHRLAIEIERIEAQEAGAKRA
jgi:transcriptional regulator with XRE-family HTH domain